MIRIIISLIGLHLLATSALAGPCSGDKFVIVKEGKIVETFEPPDFWPLLDSCSIVYQGSPPTSYDFSGRLVGDKTGYGAGEVPLLFGSGLHPARSAVQTDVEGNFKIRILIDSKAFEQSLTTSSQSDGVFFIGPGERYKHFRNREAYRSYTIESLRSCCKMAQ